MITAKKEVVKPLLKFAALCTILVLLVITMRFMLHRSLQKRISKDPNFRICQLIEIPEGPTSLRSGTIEELLGLVNADENLFAFDLQRAEDKLLSHPLIESARLWRSPPSAITVSYRVRRPFAELCEWPELLIDKSGHLFPYRPHFTPKQLPKLSLGLPKNPDSAPQQILSSQAKGILRGKRVELGLKVLYFLTAYFEDEGTQIKLVDVSLAFDKDLGRRGINLVLEDRIFLEGKPLVCRRHLRMSSERWRAQLQRYRSLLLSLAGEELRIAQSMESQQILTASKRVVEEIDLRLSQIAHLKLRLEEQDRS